MRAQGLKLKRIVLSRRIVSRSREEISRMIFADYHKYAINLLFETTVKSMRLNASPTSHHHSFTHSFRAR